MSSPTDLPNAILQKLRDRDATVGVVGLGYVGLPFAVAQARAGFRVLGVELDAGRRECVNRGESYIPDVPGDALRSLAEQGRIEALGDFARVGEMDVIVVVVPTPLKSGNAPDLQYVEAATRGIAEGLRPGQLVCLESTTYPGTTEEVMRPILEAGGLRADRDFFLAYSPERVDPGNREFNTANTTKVVGGVGPASLEVARAFYEATVSRVVPVSDTRAAEMVKLFENTFRAVNVALVNEIAVICDRMGLNVWEIVEAAATKPFGFMAFTPGPGVGGHCIPVDPHYLEWKARRLGLDARFITLASEINRAMPSFVVEKARRILGADGIALEDASILVLGVAYKANVPDCRNSPAIEIMRMFRAERARAAYHDRFVPRLEIGGEELASVELTGAALASVDLVIIATAHGGVDYADVVAGARRVLDARNATREVSEGREKITLL